MKQRRLLAVLTAAALITGCSGQTGIDPQKVQGSAIRELELDAARDLIAPQNGGIPQIAGANSFSLRLASALLDQLGNSDPDTNFVCSPYSVWMPLAALAFAVDETHRPALLDALGVAGVPNADLNSASSQMLFALTGQGRSFEGGTRNPVAIANAIFVDSSETPNREFAQAFLDFYRGSVFSADFESPEAVEAVNRWASENTDGLIDRIIEKFNPDDAAALVNAVHFSDRWVKEFDPEKTSAGVFHAPAGDVQAQFMILEANGMLCYEDAKIQAMPLKFAGGASMLVVRPKDGDAAGWLKTLTADDLNAIDSGLAEKNVRLAMPGFEIDSGELNLVDSLEALGIRLFDSGDPAIDSLLEGDPIYISNAVQKALIKVDEKGTTAAAVTLIVTTRTGGPEGAGRFDMRCDSPFVFILRADCGVILFAGVVNRP